MINYLFFDDSRIFFEVWGQSAIDANDIEPGEEVVGAPVVGYGVGAIGCDRAAVGAGVGAIGAAVASPIFAVFSCFPFFAFFIINLKQVLLLFNH